MLIEDIDNGQLFEHRLDTGGRICAKIDQNKSNTIFKDFIHSQANLIAFITGTDPCKENINDWSDGTQVLPISHVVFNLEREKEIDSISDLGQQEYAYIHETGALVRKLGPEHYIEDQDESASLIITAGRQWGQKIYSMHPNHLKITKVTVKDTEVTYGNAPTEVDFVLHDPPLLKDVNTGSKVRITSYAGKDCDFTAYVVDTSSEYINDDWVADGEVVLFTMEGDFPEYIEPQKLIGAKSFKRQFEVLS